MTNTRLPRVYLDDEGGPHGNDVYYERLYACVKAATGREPDRFQLDIAIAYDRGANADGWNDATPTGEPR